MVLTLVVAAPAHADDFPTALRELHGLRSVVTAGVTYAEYQRRVLDSKIIIDRYIARPDRDPRRRAATMKAAEVYVAASTAWNAAVSGTGLGMTAAGVAYCPPAVVSVTNGLVLLNERRWSSAQAMEQAQREIYRASLPIFWACASAWIVTAESGPEPQWPPESLVLRQPPKPPATREPTAQEIENRRRVEEERRTRPICKWVLNDGKWVAECTPVGASKPPEPVAGECPHGGTWNATAQACDYVTR